MVLLTKAMLLEMELTQVVEKKQEDIFAAIAVKYSTTIQTLFIIIFGKLRKLLI